MKKNKNKKKQKRNSHIEQTGLVKKASRIAKRFCFIKNYLKPTVLVA